MLKAINDAIKTEQFEQANSLLNELEPTHTDNLWLPFYRARLTEAQGHGTEAGHQYRQLLPLVNNPQLIAKIRQGLERIRQQEDDKQAQTQLERQAALAEAKLVPDNQSLGIFVLDIVTAEQKQAMAVNFSQIMNLDAYSARLLLPSRSWRLYRTGKMGELSFYDQQCRAQGIPSFCVALKQVLDLSVISVCHVSAMTDENLQIMYRHSSLETLALSIPWSEICQRVEGLLPIFEECVNLTPQGKVERKIEILDYAKVCDLHWPKQNTILRFCDQIYEFAQGISLSPNTLRSQESTSHEKWQQLLSLLPQYLSGCPVLDDFTLFAETAMDFPELLTLINPHISFLRREETEWDAAFHLYSGLGFHRRVGNFKAGPEP